MTKPIKFPGKAKVKAQQLLQQKQIAEMQFGTYVQGVFDSLGIDGDWNLDVNTWMIAPIQKPETSEKVE